MKQQEYDRFAAALDDDAGLTGAINSIAACASSTIASGQFDTESLPRSRVVLTCGADLTPELVQWLWPDWLALGKFHLLAGAPGQGKTTIAMGLAATVTLGGRWPDGSRCAAGTGSGKTVITAAFIEEILTGSDRFEAQPNAVFLWLSDQPVLNEQSKKRLASASTKLGNNDLVIVDTDFDREMFDGGKVYFINTQKLGKDKLLTSGRGDKRTYTIWETISNTAKAKAGCAMCRASPGRCRFPMKWVAL
jgi:hypothetical protein